MLAQYDSYVSSLSISSTSACIGMADLNGKHFPDIRDMIILATDFVVSYYTVYTLLLARSWLTALLKRQVLIGNLLKFLKEKD